jgi:uncharacterized protein YkuJ
MKIEEIYSFYDYCLFIKEVEFTNLTKEDVFAIIDRLLRICNQGKKNIKKSMLSKGEKIIETKYLENQTALLIIHLLKKTKYNKLNTYYQRGKR